MNLKLKLVAAMSVLGLVSCPVFADDTTSTTTSASTTTVTKTKHHSHHPKVMHHPVRNYKEEIPVEPAPVEVCTMSQTDLVMDMMTQNGGRALPNPCNPGWFNRIQWSGGVNVDGGKWGNRNVSVMGENYQILSINDAYLNISADVNEWTSAFVSISYNSTTINDPADADFAQHLSEYAAAYDGTPLWVATNHTLQLEQAFFTVGNFDAYPIFLQVGKQFQDFSRYEIHPVTRSMTQVISETLAVSAKLGFISQLGFNGSIYVFDDPLHKASRSNYPTNYGAALGFGQTICDWGWDLGAAYLYNLIGANDVAFNVAQFNFLAGNGLNYRDRAGGVAVYADFNYGPFVLNGRWTTAVQRFNPGDLPRHGIADTRIVTRSSCTSCGDRFALVDPAASGAKPWAAAFSAAYTFDGLWDLEQNIYVGFQTSREAAGLNLPHNRYLVGIGIDPWRNTGFTLEWDHDNAYDVVLGGTGRNSNLVTIRAATKFG